MPSRHSAGLVLLCLVSPLAAQTAPPFSCADSVQKQLSFLEGEWRVTALFRTPAAGWDTTHALASFQPDLEGCLLRQNYRGSRYGQPYRFLALWGANGAQETPLQRTFAHAQHGILSLAQGARHGDTLLLSDRFQLRGQFVIQEVRLIRHTTTDLLQVDRRSTDSGTTWIETFRATYQRAAP